jgi:hypothetical protein
MTHVTESSQSRVRFLEFDHVTRRRRYLSSANVIDRQSVVIGQLKETDVVNIAVLFVCFICKIW